MGAERCFSWIGHRDYFRGKTQAPGPWLFDGWAVLAVVVNPGSSHGRSRAFSAKKKKLQHDLIGSRGRLAESRWFQGWGAHNALAPGEVPGVHGFGMRSVHALGRSFLPPWQSVIHIGLVIPG